MRLHYHSSSYITLRIIYTVPFLSNSWTTKKLSLNDPVVSMGEADPTDEPGLLRERIEYSSMIESEFLDSDNSSGRSLLIIRVHIQSKLRRSRLTFDRPSNTATAGRLIGTLSLFLPLFLPLFLRRSQSRWTNEWRLGRSVRGSGDLITRNRLYSTTPLLATILISII